MDQLKKEPRKKKGYNSQFYLFLLKNLNFSLSQLGTT